MVLLSYLYLKDPEDYPSEISFSLSIPTQIFIWGYLQILNALRQNKDFLAVKYLKEMLVNAKKTWEMEHWAIGEACEALDVYNWYIGTIMELRFKGKGRP